MNRIIYILIILSCLFPYSILSQEDQVISSDANPIRYTEAQLDTLYAIVRDHFYEANYDKVIEQATVLIKAAQQSENTLYERRLRTVLGNAFVQIDDIDKASDLFHDALETSKKAKDTVSLIDAYINLGNTYIKEDPEHAIMHFKDALRMGEAIQNKNYIFIAENNLSELYIGINQSEKAQYHVDRALPMALHDFEDRKDEYLATVYYVQGVIFSQQARYNAAEDFLLRSMHLGIGKYQEETYFKNLKYLIEVYDNTAQFEKLNGIRKQYDSLRDERYEDEKIRQQQIARSKFNLDKVEQKLKASQLEKELAEQTASKSRLLSIFALISGFILLFFIGFLLYIRRKRFKLMKDLKLKNQQYLSAKESSEKLTQVKTKFLSTISHELRTPLYGIIGLTSVLIKNPKLQEHLENLNSLKFSADYLLSLINDVLQLNKLESETGKEIKKEYFKLENLIHSILQSFEFINQQNNNTVNVHIDSKVPLVLSGDQMKISQVLMNLVSNASKFTQDGTIVINIHAVEQGSENVQLQFVIRDTGIGIPKEQQSRIFDEFAQVTNSSEYEGTGLGLPIVNKIVKILGGQLHFDSSYGKGTSFSFTLPLEIGLESDLQTITPDISYEKLEQKNILIVDDNKINQLVTQKVLEQYGIQHQTVNNGLEAIEQAELQNFDIILMDVNMPVMNGLDSSKELRKRNINTPIIALTAVNSNDPEKDFASFGISDAIIKPYKTEKLLDLLLKYVG